MASSARTTQRDSKQRAAHTRQDNPLRHIPPVNDILHGLITRVDQMRAQQTQRAPEGLSEFDHQIAVRIVRTITDKLRTRLSEQHVCGKTYTTAVPSLDELADEAFAQFCLTHQASLRPVINASGVIIHTNLGRSLLAPQAVDAMLGVAQSYSTLEFSVETMQRGSRHSHCEELLKLLTGAEAALAINNNAAAVMMVLQTFGEGRETIISRGELVEIGGSFRIPDIMRLSHTMMVEVGTTNKTHGSDYERALSANTAIIAKVHTSNYRMIGFTEQVSRNRLKAIADQENKRRAQAGEAKPVLVYEDLGSGMLLDLPRYGGSITTADTTDAEATEENLADSTAVNEPTVAEVIAEGVDLVSFSGDKLLGGPQAGIIVGKKELIDQLKKSPLARVLRLDKLTLAALEATLHLYLDPLEAQQQIPTLARLTEGSNEVKYRAKELLAALAKELASTNGHTLELVSTRACAGGGSLPGYEIDSYGVALTLTSDNAPTVMELQRYLIQKANQPIIARITNEHLIFDAKTISLNEIAVICAEVREALTTLSADGTA